MMLNQFEKKLVGHPVRRWFQQQVEAKLLLSLFDYGPGNIRSALEIGCGFGHGITLLRHHFGAQQVTGIDLDPDLVHHCAVKHSDDAQVRVLQGDAIALDFADREFDLISNFAVFHHIPDWQLAIKECFRVLKPGGVFLLEDLYRRAICNPLSQKLFVHPQQNRFNHQQLLSQLEHSGFLVRQERQVLDLAGMILVQKPFTVVAD
ncbi:type 11 methyltransferase [Shewanella sp. NFH-SH190041]|uniref:class I SAM-dependent methyltransferase n=1 Tax=Shewanella sp. NFH-SH190041 TaxID=2950245 RepID=UPI0021C49EB0|nr:class I SAM-dependent methyltransferase [Shewanella sp. NFH-SH190041]BDM64645.1 type 11 methyltransferase [Shewanella sp. NFH-SH190041]